MTTGEWGIFNDESADWTAEEAVEADFYSREEAEKALVDYYSSEDECFVHECEESDDDEDEENDTSTEAAF